jgi:hypothetical protein
MGFSPWLNWQKVHSFGVIPEFALFYQRYLKAQSIFRWVYVAAGSQFTVLNTSQRSLSWTLDGAAGYFLCSTDRYRPFIYIKSAQIQNTLFCLPVIRYQATSG